MAMESAIESAMEGEFHGAIPVDHPAFAGHFPGHPIVPGVVLLDQALYGICQALGWPEASCQIAACKFLSPVEPGETLRIAYHCQPNGSVLFEIHGSLASGESGRIVASGKLAAREQGMPAQ